MADSRYTTLFWPFIVFLVICLAAMIGTLVFVARTANRMIDWDSQLMAAAKDIRLEATTARLWFEEIVHGEYPPDMNHVWNHLKEADKGAEQLLTQADKAQLAYVPVETPDLKRKVVTVRQKLNAVSEFTRQRWNEIDIKPAEHHVGRQYDAIFADFVNSADDLEGSTALLVEQKAQFFTSIARFSGAVTILLAALIMFVVVVHVNQRARFAREQEDALSKLGTKNDELEGLIYEGSQDMRAPLVNLQGFNAELAGSCRELAGALTDPSMPADIKQRLSSVVTEDIPNALGHMRASVDRVNTLVNGLLRLLYLGRASPRVQTVDMDALVGQIVAEMCTEADRREAVISLEPLSACTGDPEQLKEIFTGLIDNALKYLSPDRPGRIRIFGRTEHKRAVYGVEDNGVGIRPEDQAKVFRAFQRVATSECPSGEGLGLTVVKRLVIQQNGTLCLSSEPGKGSTFYVSLPAA